MTVLSAFHDPGQLLTTQFCGKSISHTEIAALLWTQHDKSRACSRFLAIIQFPCICGVAMGTNDAILARKRGGNISSSIDLMHRQPEHAASSIAGYKWGGVYYKYN